MKLSCLFIISLFSIISTAQIGIGTTNPDLSSILDITSTNKGILVPRVVLTDVSSQAPIINAPETSLLVWNSNPLTIGGEGVGFYYWDSSKWVYLINTNTISTFITPHNTLDMSYDQGGAGFGRIITADNGILLINGTDGIRTTGGTVNVVGNYLSNTSGNQMFYYPRRGAFRAGSGAWNDVSPGDGSPGIGNIGTYSVAMGFNTQATEQYAVALVNNSSAEAESAVAIGNGARAVQQDDMALGQSAVADGSSAIAIGESSEATGTSSIAIGSAAHSIGDQSTALGKSCQAEGDNSTAIGFGSEALGNESLAIGNGVRADAFSEFSLGVNNTNGGGDSENWVATDRLLSIGNGSTASTQSNALVILKNGDTGVGLDIPTEKLDVNGNVKATNFISATTTYPDYVFEKYFDGYSKINTSYEMLSLNEAEQYVKENGHLYRVMSYSQVQENEMNINLAEIATKNLEKIEELFLYILELKNENQILKIKIEKLEKRIIDN